MRKNNCLFFCFLMTLFSLFSATVVYGTEAQNVETQGSIGFTGVYEPIGTPDPEPPESIERPPIKDIAKPGGSLPQTNTTSSKWLVWLGISIISIVSLSWKRKKQRNIKIKTTRK